MNKKFLSAVLFGAMLATTTSTFVSCKDYDDDIAGLQEQIDGVKSNLTSEAAALRSELATAKTQLESELASAQSALQAAINTNASDIDALEARVATIESKITAIDTLTTQLNKLSEDMATADAAALKAIEDGIAEVKAETKALLNKNLTSLVLNPDLYLNGIEAIKINTIEYTSLGTTAVSADLDCKNDAPTTGSAVQMTPMLAATYHMNPSTADLSGLTNENFRFLAADKQMVTRAASTLKHEILSAVPSNGDLTVSAKFTNGSFATEGQTVTTLALEVETEKGKVVTSDYAAVYAEAIKGFLLDNEKTTACDELYKTAALAIANDPIVKVAWNETVDLADYVETHYLSTTGCAKLAEDKLKGYGFSYKYELVGYYDGQNQTSQSAHAGLNGSELRPQLPSDGKAATWGSTEQNPATIGRMPLVRVTLVDNNSNKNVAVGYVKVEITATPGKNTIGATTSKTFNNPFTLSCARSLEPLNLKWFEIEETILTQLGISKTEFDANYTYDAGKFFTTNTLEAAETTVNGVTVVEGTDLTTGTTTEVLKMTVDAAVAYNHFLKNTSLSVIVRYYKQIGTDAFNKPVYDYVYVTLTWAPSPLNVNPVGTISNDNKIQQYWFADDNHEGGSGYNEIHVNVNVPGNGSVTTENFLKNIYHTFNNDKIVISGVESVYADFQDEDLTKTLIFPATQSTTPLVGTDGKTYVLKGNGAEKLYAVDNNGLGVATVIAILSNDGVITYQNNDAAKALLNAAGREDLSKNVTATVMVKEVNGCGKQLIELTNKTFDVKFLRPISVAQAEMESFKDGVDVGAEGSVVDLKLNFTDWRNYAFVDSYFAHYGVTKIEANIAEAETNVSGQWASLPTGMTISYNNGAAFTPTKVGEYGQVKYVNNNAEVGNFSIKVPFTVTYVWGTIELVVEFQVAKTV